MKMKKVLGLVMTTTMLMSSNVFGSSFDIMHGTGSDIEEAYNYTQEELEVIEQKRLEINQNGNMRYYPKYTYNTLSVPVYEQETSYYCGPATVKQVTAFMKGSADSQKYIADKIFTNRDGTTMPYMLYYLNDEKKLNYTYDEGIASNYGTWMNAIYKSVDNRKPAIMIVTDKSGSVLPYTTSGHYVNVSGYDTGGASPFRASSSSVRITDPWTPGLGNRWYDSYDLNAIAKNHWRKALIW